MKRWLSGLVILVVLLPFGVGCQSHFYHARLPLLEKPVRPQLQNVAGTEMKKMSPEAQQAVSSNFNKLLDHVKKLEAALDEYNKFAEGKNKEIGFGGTQ